MPRQWRAATRALAGCTFSRVCHRTAEKWPVLGRHARAAEWLGIWADLGRAPDLAGQEGTVALLDIMYIIGSSDDGPEEGRP